LGIHLFSPVNSFFFRKLRFNSNLTPLSSIQSFSPFGKKAEQFDHELAAAETVAVLERQKRLLKAILSVYGLQFKELWKRWCRQREVEAFFACPSHHEDKVRLNGASEVLTENSLIHCASFLACSKANWASAETGLTIHVSTEA
jgi:hypothetical protein